VGLPEGEEITTLAFFFLTQYRLVTDGWTDGQTDRHVTIAITRASSVARVKIDGINTGHHRNLDTIGKHYQEPGVEAELNFEFFEFTIVLNNDRPMGTEAFRLRP